MQALKELIPLALADLQKISSSKKNLILERWPSIVGPKIAAHSKPSLGRNQDLWVWVDQSALAFELNQKYRQTILKRVQAALGAEVVKAVHVRVGQLR